MNVKVRGQHVGGYMQIGSHFKTLAWNTEVLRRRKISLYTSRRFLQEQEGTKSARFEMTVSVAPAGGKMLKTEE